MKSVGYYVGMLLSWHPIEDEFARCGSRPQEHECPLFRQHEFYCSNHHNARTTYVCTVQLQLVHFHSIQDAQFTWFHSGSDVLAT